MSLFYFKEEYLTELVLVFLRKAFLECIECFYLFMFTLLIIIYQRENQRHVFVFATTTEINSWHCCIIYRLCPQTDYVIGDKMMHICTDAILLSTLHVQP